MDQHANPADVLRVVRQSKGLPARGKDLYISARSLLRLEGPAPSFFIVGTQKGGTTYLDSLLRSHPGLSFPLKKEVHYFDNHHGRGDRWYRSHFLRADRSTSKQAGESSPYYMFHPLAMKRIQAFDPAAKIIVLLRDPVKRAVSHYKHNLARATEYLSFRDAIAAEPVRMAGQAERIVKHGEASSLHQHFSYFERGCYAAQLKTIFGLFGRPQVLVLKSEQLFRRPASVVDMACGFLGVQPPQQIAAGSAKRNANEMEAEIDAETLEDLRRRYAGPDAELFGLLGWTGYGDDVAADGT